MYTAEDVEMVVQDTTTELSTRAWNEEYLHVHMQSDYAYYGMGLLLSKEHAELLRDTLDVFLEGGYDYEDVEMLVQDEDTELSTRAWNEEYLHLHMRDDYDVMGMLLSKEQAELLRDTLDVFLEGGYDYEDVEMLVQDEHIELSTRAWNEEYLHVTMYDDYDSAVMCILLSKEHAELLRNTLDVFLEGGYADKDVEMLVQDKDTELSTRAWHEGYLHVHMRDDYVYAGMDLLLSEEHAELLRDTLNVFLEGGYIHE